MRGIRNVALLSVMKGHGTVQRLQVVETIPFAVVMEDIGEALMKGAPCKLHPLAVAREI